MLYCTTLKICFQDVFPCVTLLTVSSSLRVHVYLLQSPLATLPFPTGKEEQKPVRTDRLPLITATIVTGRETRIKNNASALTLYFQLLPPGCKMWKCVVEKSLPPHMWIHLIAAAIPRITLSLSFHDRVSFRSFELTYVKEQTLMLLKHFLSGSTDSPTLFL